MNIMNIVKTNENSNTYSKSMSERSAFTIFISIVPGRRDHKKKISSQAMCLYLGTIRSDMLRVK